MSSRTEAGAALVESIMIFSLMAILVAGIPKIAKLQSVRQVNVESTRYATWQMTVSDGANRERVIDRFYSAPDAPITSQVSQMPDNPYWRKSASPSIRSHAFSAANSHLGSRGNGGETLLDKRSVEVVNRDSNASKGLVADAVTGTVKTVSGWLGKSDAIASNYGIVQSSVQVEVNTDGVGSSATVNCGDGSNHCLQNNSSILVDGWAAENPAAVEAGSQVMVPTTLIKPIGRAMSAISVVPLLKEFKDFDRSLGCVNTSTLPTQQLTGALNSESDTHEC